MLKEGMLVRVIYPEYAAGMRGYIIAQELFSERWLIQLEADPFGESKTPFILSLEESEFEAIAPDEEKAETE